MENENHEVKNDDNRHARKKQNFIYIAVFSVLLWISGLTLFIIHSYFSAIKGFEGELSNFSLFAHYFSLISLLAAVILFLFNLLSNRKP